MLYRQHCRESARRRVERNSRDNYAKQHIESVAEEVEPEHFIKRDCSSFCAVLLTIILYVRNCKSFNGPEARRAGLVTHPTSEASSVKEQKKEPTKLISFNCFFGARKMEKRIMILDGADHGEANVVRLQSGEGCRLGLECEGFSGHISY